MDFSYEALRAECEAQGLYERTYIFYAVYTLFVTAGIATSILLLFVTDNFFFQIGNSLMLTFFLVQAGMLGHDYSHGQVFKSKRLNRFGGTIILGLLDGISESQWFKKHNAHHVHVNHADDDPDMGLPFFFCEKQLEKSRSSIKKLLLPYQHIIFFLSLPLVYFIIFFEGMRHLFSQFSKRSVIEITFIAIHFGGLAYLVFSNLPIITAIVFLVIHTLVGGLYLSLVFAPNHKGKTVLHGSEKPTWVDQITLTRNIKPTFTAFFLLGGLNFQIEHHLFSNMPRLRYFRARKIVREFCKNNDIEYDETTWFGSMKEIYLSLRAIGRGA